MCCCRGGYEGSGCEGGPECLDDEGGPLDLAALAELADRIGCVPRREFRCHPSVSRLLMLTLPEAEPGFPFTGSIGALTGIPVIENADFEPGAWELREDGEVTASGRIEVPAFVAPVDLTPMSFPRVIDRTHPWFPYVPPSLLSISSAI
jgi:hypothetical protein